MQSFVNLKNKCYNVIRLKAWKVFLKNRPAAAQKK